MTTLARLVARVRDAATGELYATLAGLADPQRAAGWRAWWCCPGRAVLGPGAVAEGPGEPSGRHLERALHRAAEIIGVGVGALSIDAHVPRRRLVDLARYGMRHGPGAAAARH